MTDFAGGVGGRAKVTDLTHIWCEGCRSIQPVLIDEMLGMDVSGCFVRPTDIMCATCRLVLVTMYNPKPENDASVFAEYEREMTEEGIPKIIKDVKNRQLLAEDARHRLCGATTTEVDPEA